MKKNELLITFLAFSMYFLTGAACIIVGSSLIQLIQMYGMELEKVVLLGSSFALGRVVTVYKTGQFVEKYGPKKILVIGISLIFLFLIGIPNFTNYYAGLFFAFLGGIGMGAQDTVCPVLLSQVFKKNYAGALSAGQALFGLGGFFTPFLIGIFLSNNMPFYFAYYVLLLVPIIMLICIPFVEIKDNNISANEDNEKTIKPLYVKNSVLSYIALFMICLAYCAVVNTLSLYTSSFGKSIGLTESMSAFLLTTYNVGSVVGAFTFVIILKKVKEQNVLFINNIFAFVTIYLALYINTEEFYFLALFILGFFLGVLFSIIVSIATRIGYKKISIASSIIATIGGISDIGTPIITGNLLDKFGISFSFKYAMIMILICIVFSSILRLNITEISKKKRCEYVNTK